MYTIILVFIILFGVAMILSVPSKLQAMVLAKMSSQGNTTNQTNKNDSREEVTQMMSMKESNNPNTIRMDNDEMISIPSMHHSYEDEEIEIEEKVEREHDINPEDI